MGQTPSQTAGPFFAYGLTPDQYGYEQLASLVPSDLASSETPGTRIAIEGRVFDGGGEPIHDALVELWQADDQGRYAHPADPRNRNSRFLGFGRCGTGSDPDCRFRFETVKPGVVEPGFAPFVTMIITMRGLLNHLYTRAYFSDEPLANETDPILRSVSADRRNTLIAERRDTPNGPVYTFDIHMQGSTETVFFDL